MMSQFKTTGGFVFLLFLLAGCGGSGSTPMVSSTAPAPWKGTKQLGSVGHDNSKGVAVDGSGNVYVTGLTTSGLDENTSAGGVDMVLVKYDPSGAKKWTKQVGSTGDDYGSGVAVDPSGNVYVTGFTNGGLDGNTNAGGTDMFLVKYDPTGVKQWTRQLGSATDDYSTGVTVDSSGNVYVTGYTNGGLDANTSAGSLDMFLVKYDPLGAKKWTRQLGSAGNDFGYGVAVDSSGNVLVAGATNGGLDSNTHIGDYDLFLSKYDKSGVKQWTKQHGSTALDFGSGVTVDSNDNVYITGSTYGGLDGNTNAGGVDMFLIKYNSSGARQWTTQLGNLANDMGTNVAVDSNDNIYISGTTTGVLDGNTSAGGIDFFLVKYDPSGSQKWTKQMGSNGDEISCGLAAVSSGVYATGYTNGALDENTNAGGFDMFLLKYDSAGIKQ